MNTEITILNEIKNLHEYFEDWFAGKLEEAEITRLENVLTEDFILITPQGEEIHRDALIKSIAQSYGKNNKMKIVTKNIRIFKKTEDIYLALYEEHQHGKKDTRRLSTALFIITQSSIKWSHVHETWIEN